MCPKPCQLTPNPFVFGPKVARARPTLPLGLWLITSLLCGNFYIPCLHKFLKWIPDNDVTHRN